MNTIPYLSNSAIPVARDDLERILKTLTAIQEVSGLAASIIIDRLNEVDGDPNTEDDDPDEVQGDEKDCAWIEWTTIRGSQKRGPNILAGHEDDEDSDPLEDDDPTGQCDEDCFNTRGDLVSYATRANGPGCTISDSDCEWQTIPGGSGAA